jgi:hypothetical protein
MILLGQVRREHVQGRQVDVAARDQLEGERKPLRRPHRCDAVPGRALREMKPLDAEREQGRARFAQV